MRIALLADIHGNSIALDAVFADIQRRGGVDAYWVLGDLCAVGFDPIGVLERLQQLPNAIFIQGNADRYMVTEQLPPPSQQEAIDNPDLIPVLVEVAASLGWTKGALAGCHGLEWLRNMPLEESLILPDGTSVLLTHVAPGQLDGDGIPPSLTDAQFKAALGDCSAGLICVGHFHMAMDRRLNGQRVISPGSISNNFPPDLRAAYAILTTDTSDYDVAFHRVDYDRDACIRITEQVMQPGIGFITRLMRGEIRATWLDSWDGKSFYPDLT